MIVWQAWDNDGIESLDLLFEPDRIEAHGTMIRMREGAPLRIDYIVIADPAWCAKSLYARSNGREIKLDLDGDADLWACAFTNSLPVRRTNFAATIETTMPFITHDLRVESATQRYTRLDARTYRFESLTSGWISRSERSGSVTNCQVPLQSKISKSLSVTLLSMYLALTTVARPGSVS